MEMRRSKIAKSKATSPGRSCSGIQLALSLLVIASTLTACNRKEALILNHTSETQEKGVLITYFDYSSFESEATLMNTADLPASTIFIINHTDQSKSERLIGTVNVDFEVDLDDEKFKHFPLIYTIGSMTNASPECCTLAIHNNHKVIRECHYVLEQFNEHTLSAPNESGPLLIKFRHAKTRQRFFVVSINMATEQELINEQLLGLWDLATAEELPIIAILDFGLDANHENETNFDRFLVDGIWQPVLPTNRDEETNQSTLVFVANMKTQITARRFDEESKTKPRIQISF